MTGQQRRYTMPFAVVTSLFFMWGFTTVLVDALVPRLRDVFELTYAQASLVQVYWFIAYAVFSIPAGLLLSRVGYKRGVLSGLLLVSVGCLLFYPAAELRMFGFFLTALFVLASGITVLQVAANPYISVLGMPERAASRLNLAQAFNSLGTTLAPMVAAAYLLSDRILSEQEVSAMTESARSAYYAAEASAVQGPFMALGVVFFLLAGLFSVTRLPSILEDRVLEWSSFAKVIRNRRLMFGALAIFLYVGAEVAIGSYLTNYFMQLGLEPLILESEVLRGIVETVSRLTSSKTLADLDPKGVVGTFVVFYWGMAMIGRFVGSWLTGVIKPGVVLSLFGIGAILLILTSAMTSGLIAMFSILAVGFFNSVMFPTIFTLALDELGELKPEGSGILCTAIVGGAVIPNIVGRIADATGSFQLAFPALVACYAGIILYAFRYVRRTALAT